MTRTEVPLEHADSHSVTSSTTAQIHGPPLLRQLGLAALHPRGEAGAGRLRPVQVVVHEQVATPTGGQTAPMTPVIPRGHPADRVLSMRLPPLARAALGEARAYVQLDAVPSSEVLKGQALRARRRRIEWSRHLVQAASCSRFSGSAGTSCAGCTASRPAVSSASARRGRGLPADSPRS